MITLAAVNGLYALEMIGCNPNGHFDSRDLKPYIDGRYTLGKVLKHLQRYGYIKRTSKDETMGRWFRTWMDVQPYIRRIMESEGWVRAERRRRHPGVEGTAVPPEGLHPVPGVEMA